MSKKNPHWGTSVDRFLSEEDIHTPKLTIRDALRQIWLADSYPILGNEDRRISTRMETEALERAGKAVAAPDDPPEFAAWIAALRDPKLPNHERNEIMSSLYDLFDPDRD